MSTLYIYLDESGSFQLDNRLSLIAGVICRAESGEAPETHMEQIRSCLMRAAQQWGFVYPAALHSTENAQLNSKIKKSFPEVTASLFKTRRYTPFLTVCLPTEIDADKRIYEQSLEGLYRHMLRQALAHIAAAYPDADALHFYIPTRTVPIAPGQESGYRDLGMRLDSVSEDRRYMAEVNSSGAHIATKDLLSRMTHAQIHLHVSTIEYISDNADCQCGYRLADWLNCYCNSLCQKQVFPITNTSRIDLSQLSIQLGSVFHVPGKAQILSYGRYYDWYDAALQSARTPEPSDYLLHLYNLSRPGLEHIAPYVDTLIQHNPFGDERRIRAMDDYLYFNYYIQARYSEVQPLYALLIELGQRAGMGSSAPLGAVKAKMMCCWQHTGEAKKAQALFDACWQQMTSASSRLDLINKYIQSLLDTLQYEDAQEYIEWAMEEFAPKRGRRGPSARLLYRDDAELLTIMSKCRSTRGQISGFLEEEDGAVWFQKALAGFADQPANYSITVSHLLHYALSRLDFDTFAAYAPAFFGAEETDYRSFSVWASWYGALAERIHRETDAPRPDTSSRFALLIYLKALYLYLTHAHEAPDAWKDDVRTLLFGGGTFPDLCGRLGAPEHPFELIDKYAALIAGYCHEYGVADACENRLLRLAGESTGTVQLIARIGLCQLAVHLGKSSQLQKRKTELLSLLRTLKTQWTPIQEDGMTLRIDELIARCEQGDARQIPYESLLTYEYT